MPARRGCTPSPRAAARRSWLSRSSPQRKTSPPARQRASLSGRTESAPSCRWHLASLVLLLPVEVKRDQPRRHGDGEEPNPGEERDFHVRDPPERKGASPQQEKRPGDDGDGPCSSDVKPPFWHYADSTPTGTAEPPRRGRSNLGALR